MMHILVKDGDGNIVFDADANEDEKLTAEDVNLWWNGREYVFRSPAIWWTAGIVTVQWIDDTDTDPRHADQPADVLQTVEYALPGGGMGPFVVCVE